MTQPYKSDAINLSREYEFSDADFLALCALVRQLTGIYLTTSKRELVYGRISRRLRLLKLASFAEYRRLLEKGGDETAEFCNAMTTNLTSFFRESHHFEFFRNNALAQIQADPRTGKRIRIWSAGCSTGEEPYSLAMTIVEAFDGLQGWDIKILATDVDSNVLETARRGVYPAERLQSVDKNRVARFFRETTDSTGTYYEVAAKLKALVTFKQLNLMHDLPMRGPLHAIFCRNVIIYFEKDTQRDLFARIACLQREGDLLFVGHSENLSKVTDAYKLIGKTIYRRHGP